MIAIGYILGILWGLYFKTSIVLFFGLCAVIGTILKYTKIHRYRQYFKVVMNKKVLIIIAFFAVLSNTITIVQNNSYENKYKGIGKVEMSRHHYQQSKRKGVLL